MLIQKLFFARKCKLENKWILLSRGTMTQLGDCCASPVLQQTRARQARVPTDCVNRVKQSGVQRRKTTFERENKLMKCKKKIYHRK